MLHHACSGIRRNWLKRWFELENGELAYWADDDKDEKKGAVNLFSASEIRQSEAPNATDEELEIVTDDRTWRMRAESEEDLQEWLSALNTALEAVKATQGKTAEQMLVEAGLVYRCPDLGIPWLGLPPAKASHSSHPVKAKPFEVYGLHGSMRKLKICLGWWIKGHKPWKPQNGIHAGIVLLNSEGCVSTVWICPPRVAAPLIIPRARPSQCPT